MDVRREILAILLVVLGYLWAPAAVEFLPPKAQRFTLASDGTRREFFLYLSPRLDLAAELPLVIFLQGFDLPEGPSPHVWDHYHQICAEADRLGFIAAFPRGLQGSFPEAPHLLAWYPEGHLRNRRFLRDLVNHLCGRLPIDPQKICCAGFSNGAYFGAIELLTDPDSPFQAFWLDGGGYPYALVPGVPRKKVLISIGDNDEHNRGPVEELTAFLRENGWQENRTMRIRRHLGAHTLCPEAVPELLGLLFSPTGGT